MSPYKDPQKAREAATERQRKHRQGVTQEGVTSEGVTWEAIPLEDIKAALPLDIVSYILRIGERFGNTEQRLRREYKYQVWHDKNFINGVHRGLLETNRPLEGVVINASTGLVAK